MMTTTAVACAGFADYGVNVNPSKTRLSFEMVTSGGAKLQVMCHHNLWISQSRSHRFGVNVCTPVCSAWDKQMCY